MNILTKYILKEIIKTYFIVLLTVVAVFFLFHFLEEVGKDYPLIEKFRYVLYALPAAANSFFPFAIMISVIIVVGRLNSNNELQILHSAALSTRNVLRKIIELVLIISVVSMVIGEIFSPYFYIKANHIKSVAIGENINKKKDNIWIKKNNSFVNLSTVNNSDKLKKISLYDFDKNRLKSFEFSERGNIVDENLVLINPRKVIFLPNNLITSVKNSPLSKTSISLNPDELKIFDEDEKTFYFFDLINAYLIKNKDGLSTDSYVSEIFSRALKPFYIIAMILIASPFVMNFNRNQSIGNMIFIGIALGISFHLFSKIINIAALTYAANIWLASTLPTLLALGISFIVLKRFLGYK